VNSIPSDAVKHDEGDTDLYQYASVYFSKVTTDEGKTTYRVEPAPPAESIDSIPDGTTTLIAGGETYYYVNKNLYIKEVQDGKTSYVNSEPPVHAAVDELPEGATVVQEDGDTYFQFDMVFLKQNDNGKYEVVESPDDSETTTLGAES